MTDEAFQKLKKFTEVELKLTPDNVMDKAISFNNLYIHYHNLYVAERGKLKDINNNMRKTYAELYHYYKFEGFDFKLVKVIMDNNLTWIDENLEKGKYIYKIIGVNELGEGSPIFSDSIEITQQDKVRNYI